MPAPAPDDSLLLIRCPSCGQRFKVGEDLRNRTVECGGCEHRFRINDDVIVRGRKFYPGERHGSPLNRFQRVPLPGGDKMMGVQSIRYSASPDPVTVEPASPQRIIAGIIAVILMITVALVLMFAGFPGGMLDGMVLPHRLVMAGFTGLLGFVLLVYANPRARMKAGFFGLLMAAVLIAIPFFFKAGAKLPQPSPTAISNKDATKPVAKDPEMDSLRTKIGITPLEDETARLAHDGNTHQAVGVWLRNLTASNRFLVRDYMLRVTHADPSYSHDYPRGGGDRLLVLSGIAIPIHEVAEFTKALGNEIKIHDEISVIEVQVLNDNFIEGPIAKLSNKEDPAFYELNKRELESIDLERAKHAVQRLSEAPPKLYRADITRKLIALLGEEGVDYKNEVSRALKVWAETPGPASEAALAEVRKLVAKNQTVPEEMMALIVKEKNLEVLPLIDALWAKDPMAWESAYGDIGTGAESTVLQHFSQTEGVVRYSAVRILGRVGTAASLPVLDQAAVKGDAELKVLVEQAKKSIHSRE